MIIIKIMYKIGMKAQYKKVQNTNSVHTIITALYNCAWGKKIKVPHLYAKGIRVTISTSHEQLEMQSSRPSPNPTELESSFQQDS